MPTISEDEGGSRRRRVSAFSGDEDERVSMGSEDGEDDDTNYVRLMDNVIEEKEKLMETLAETQDELSTVRGTVQQLQRERDTLHRQLYANKPQVGEHCDGTTEFINYDMFQNIFNVYVYD